MPFSERLAVVQLNASNAVEELLNLNDDAHFFLGTKTFKIVAPVATRVLAQDQRRWGGARQVGETHENASVAWEAMVAGASEQQALEKVEVLLAQLAANPTRLFLLWQAAGVSEPSLYEARGTGHYEPAYDVGSLEGAGLFPLQIEIPVGPLAQGLPVKVYEEAGLTLPTTISLEPIPGDAPAKGEVTIETGEEPNQSFVTGASGPQMIAVQGEYIYWANELANTIGRAKTNGTSVNQSFITGANKPVGVAVSPEYIYWSNSGTGTIGRATLAGASVNQSFVTTGGAPQGVAINGEHIYWCNLSTGYIGRATITGGSIEDTWFEASGSPTGLAIDASYLYWVSPGLNIIGRASLASPASHTDYFIEGSLYPRGVAVSNRYIYWTNQFTGYIGRALITGGEVNQAWSYASSPTGVGLNSEYVYWCDASTNNTIGRVAVEHSPAIWALLGWATKPTVGLAVAPFGLLESKESTHWPWVYQGVAGARGGSAVVGAEVLNGTLVWAVDPAAMVPDSFRGEIAVEVWARVLLGSSLASPTAVVFTQPQDGTGYGAPRYTDEWGSRGRPLTVPSGADYELTWRMTRLGTLHLLVNPLAPRVWYLTLEMSAEANSSYWGVDYLLLVPVTQRACSPSSKENNASYPRFIANVGPTVKTVKSNLSALISMPGKNGHPDNGLGGQLLEFPAGETELLVKLSSLVPDSPEVNASSEQLSHTAKVTVWVTPRFFLARTV